MQANGILTLNKLSLEQSLQGFICLLRTLTLLRLLQHLHGKICGPNGYGREIGKTRDLRKCVCNSFR